MVRIGNILTRYAKQGYIAVKAGVDTVAKVPNAANYTLFKFNYKADEFVGTATKAAATGAKAAATEAVKAGRKATATATGAVKAGIKVTKAGVKAVGTATKAAATGAKAAVKGTVETVKTATKAAVKEAKADGEKITDAANYALLLANFRAKYQLFRFGNHIVRRSVKKIPDELIKGLKEIGIDPSNPRIKRAIKAYMGNHTLKKLDNYVKGIFNGLTAFLKSDPKPGPEDILLSSQVKALFKRYFPNLSLEAVNREHFLSYYPRVKDLLGEEGMEVIDAYFQKKDQPVMEKVIGYLKEKFKCRRVILENTN